VQSFRGVLWCIVVEAVCVTIEDVDARHRSCNMMAGWFVVCMCVCVCTVYRTAKHLSCHQ
jgi:hypothetical protein